MLGYFLYSPPSDKVDIFDTLFNVLCSLNSSLFSNLILLGDFNVNYLDSTSSLYTLLHSIISSFDLTQVVQEPTSVVDNGSATLIDPAFLSNPSCCEECSVIPPLSNSEHNGISLTLKWGAVKSLSLTKSGNIHKPPTLNRPVHLLMPLTGMPFCRVTVLMRYGTNGPTVVCRSWNNVYLAVLYPRGESPMG